MFVITNIITNTKYSTFGCGVYQHFCSAVADNIIFTLGMEFINNITVSEKGDHGVNLFGYEFYQQYHSGKGDGTIITFSRCSDTFMSTFTQHLYTNVKGYNLL